MHSQTSTAALLKFVKQGPVMLFHTLLVMGLRIHAGIDVKPY